MERREPKTKFGICLALIIALIFSLSLPSITQAQEEITLDLILQPELTRSQVLGLSSLGINRSGQGTPFFNLVVRNNENRLQSNLYFDIQIQSGRVGTVAELYQEAGRPFSLDPMQVVAGNNNQLQDGLPGIEESIRFDGGLTDEGEEFLNSLSGSTRLPADIYTVVLSIYRGNNSRNGGILVTSIEQSLGQNLTSDNTIDLYLLQPGGELGSDAGINSQLPVFRWDGPPNLEYRLLVVEDNGQSPEALLQAATSSDPVVDDRGIGTGSLLEFEVLDALVNRTTFPFPSSGVPRLEPGTRYYWQVFTQRETLNGVESVPSEIWEFILAPDGSGVEMTVNRELQNSLRRILGTDRYNRLQQDGFRFMSIVIDGQELQGAAAIIRLQELGQQLVDGDLTVVIN